jgi:hypothetical protein
MPDTSDRIDALAEIVAAVAAAVSDNRPALARDIGGRVRVVMRECVGRPAAFDEATMFLSRFESQTADA